MLSVTRVKTQLYDFENPSITNTYLTLSHECGFYHWTDCSVE